MDIDPSVFKLAIDVILEHFGPHAKAVVVVMSKNGPISADGIKRCELTPNCKQCAGALL